ncbi:hypothetical protein HSX11_10355 [Oxalobacteraceae bacterium]|nr:hypothetical protein [Oxalobacteraceae bacterium]
MRRFLVILLLLILPVQVTLAAVDLCCGYTKGSMHKPCDDEPAEQSRATPVKAHVASQSSIDVHCALCFLGSVGFMSAPSVRKMPTLVDRSAVPPGAGVLFVSHVFPRPERPQWPHAV